MIKILFLGDIDDEAGLQAIKKILPRLKRRYQPDITIANGENVSSGIGLLPEDARFLFNSGIDVITMGNHTWIRKEIIEFIKKEKRLIRPINYPEGVPGSGVYKFSVKGEKIAVINAMGRESIVNIFGQESFETLDDPFEIVSNLVDKLINEGYKIIVVDFHGESGIEKKSFGFYLDGRVSAILGTHTHIQTADAKIFKNGTAYITDAGMTGALDSIVGVDKDSIIPQYTKHIKLKVKGATGDIAICGVYLEIDEKTGKALKIKPFCEHEYPEISANILWKFSKISDSCYTITELSKKACEFIDGLILDGIYGHGIAEWNRYLNGFIIRETINISGEDKKYIQESLNKIRKMQGLGGFARFPVRDRNMELMAYIKNGFNSVYFFLVPSGYSENLNYLGELLLLIYKKYSKIYENILLKEKINEISALYKVGQVVASTLKLFGKNGLLDRIMNMVREVMNSEACSILLKDEKKDELYFEIGQGEKGEVIKEIRLKIGQGIAGWVAKTGKSCIVPDTSKDNRFFKGADKKTEFKTRSIIAVPLKIKGKIIGVIEVLNKKGETTYTNNDLELLEAISQLVVNSIDNAKLYHSIKRLYKSTIQVLANAMDSKDPYTHGHSRRVARYSVMIAREMGLPDNEQEDIYFAALLHDIGKIGIRDNILCKPGKLTDEEYRIIKEHPVISAQILEPVEFLKDKIPMVKHHHERYDGRGYPDGLKGENIPLGARIITVADSFDAMTSDRSYRRRMDFNRAIEELKNCSGAQFDPEIVDLFVKVYETYKHTDLFNIESDYDPFEN